MINRMKNQLHCATHRPRRNPPIRTTTTNTTKTIDVPETVVVKVVSTPSSPRKQPKRVVIKEDHDSNTARTSSASSISDESAATSSSRATSPAPSDAAAATAPPKDRSIQDFNTKEELRRALQHVDPETGGTDWKLNKFDVQSSFPDPNNVENELERLLVLKSYNVLETEKEPEFEAITEQCKQRFGCPIAAISLIDLGRQWFKSIAGLEVEQTPRCVAFCAHVVQRKARHGCMVVPDATKDERFKDNPLVKDGLKIRFYAGAPLVAPEGQRLGSLCIIDTEPHPEGLSPGEIDELETLAREVVLHLITRLEDDNVPIWKKVG